MVKIFVPIIRMSELIHLYREQRSWVLPLLCRGIKNLENHSSSTFPCGK